MITMFPPGLEIAARDALRLADALTVEKQSPKRETDLVLRDRVRNMSHASTSRREIPSMDSLYRKR